MPLCNPSIENTNTAPAEDFGDSDELHFVCYCINNYKEDVRKHADIIADHPGFSLSHFAYNLAGSYFGKTVHIRFVSNCIDNSIVFGSKFLSAI